MHVNVKIYIRFQILLVWTFTEYYINIFGGAERYSGPPRNNFGGAAAPPLPTPLDFPCVKNLVFFVRGLRAVQFIQQIAANLNYGCFKGSTFLYTL